MNRRIADSYFLVHRIFYGVLRNIACQLGKVCLVRLLTDYNSCDYRIYGIHIMDLNWKLWDVLTSYCLNVTSCYKKSSYRPPIKLQEANIFTDVCLSFSSGGSTSHASWDRWSTPMEYHPLSSGIPYLLLVTSGGDHWRLVQSCSFEDLPYPLQGVTSSGGNWNWNTYRF